VAPLVYLKIDSIWSKVHTLYTCSRVQWTGHCVPPIELIVVRQTTNKTCLSQAPHEIASSTSNITDVTRQFGAELDLRVSLVTQSLLANQSLLIHSLIHSSVALQLLVGPWPLLQFRNFFYTECRTLWASDQPVSRLRFCAPLAYRGTWFRSLCPVLLVSISQQLLRKLQQLIPSCNIINQPMPLHARKLISGYIRQYAACR
jgi:hypothetical protein